MARTHTHEDYSQKVEIQGSSDRGFGLVFSVFFLIVALWPLRVGQSVRLWALALAGAFAVASFTRPSLLHPFNAVWTRLGLLLGKIVAPVVTGLLFFLVFTPMALAFRLLGKDLLRLRFDPAAASYWIERHPPGPAPETMSHQF
jgi:hypothetical protein